MPSRPVYDRKPRSAAQSGHLPRDHPPNRAAAELFLCSSSAAKTIFIPHPGAFQQLSCVDIVLKTLSVVIVQKTVRGQGCRDRIDARGSVCGNDLGGEPGRGRRGFVYRAGFYRPPGERLRGRGLQLARDAARGDRTIDRAMATGVTRFYPTVITGAPEGMRGALNLAAAQSLEGAAMEGFHVEGPHISPKDGPRGAHLRAGFARRPGRVPLAGRGRRDTVRDAVARVARGAGYIEALVGGRGLSIGHTGATSADRRRRSRRRDHVHTLGQRGASSCRGIRTTSGSSWPRTGWRPASSWTESISRRPF